MLEGSWAGPVTAEGVILTSVTPGDRGVVSLLANMKVLQLSMDGHGGGIVVSVVHIVVVVVVVVVVVDVDVDEGVEQIVEVIVDNVVGELHFLGPPHFLTRTALQTSFFGTQLLIVSFR